MEEETYTCFFYGTLMAFPILSRVIYGTQNPDPWQKERLRVRPAILHDHCRHRVKGVDYPGVIAQSGNSVRGTVVEGLSKVDIERLDIFEGDEYERLQVDVNLLSNEQTLDISRSAHETGEVIQAGIYIWVQGTHYLEDAEWDFDHFTKQKLRNWVGDSKNFEFQESGAPDPMGGRWWARPDEVDATANSAAAATPTPKPDINHTQPKGAQGDSIVE
ncbi:hypothetical protein DRE_06291 [Drechslerella stenobrocha 248]|uniref:Putative gamma-glutamylcyclotransferase n=1 Tax=Drechslerella stenobrocha 248 TaxID=1043628 RepID=W7HM02_9PEZI|nr:hypothetical protein DRE_06291 [Drechslerella stenobrocha 248]